jgi:sialate O-acetylesterase
MIQETTMKNILTGLIGFVTFPMGMNSARESSGNMNMKRRGICVRLRNCRKIAFNIAFGTLLLMLSSLHGADSLKLPALFSDNMVLQQKQEIPVWGWAKPGQSVTVKLEGQSKTATTGKDGCWKVQLKPLKAGGPLKMTIVADKTIKLKNILVGEVWICSGQSNMERSVQSSANSAKEIAAAKYPRIRLFRIPRSPSKTSGTDCKATWVECSPSTVGSFSAVGYYFGRTLNKKLKVPVGLIQSAYGNTTAEAWTSNSALKNDSDLKHFAKIFRFMAPVKPQAQLFKLPTALYKGMIAPLIPYAIRGVIWYQGESNDYRAYQYRKLFSVLIKDWRNRWKQGDFPFLFVQLANFGKPPSQPGPSTWAELREAQDMALALPKTGMAVTVDIGDAKNIHPKNKQDVGLRLALWALATTYGKKNMVYSGPLYDSCVVKGNKIQLNFKHFGKGLEAKGGALKQFSIAGADKKFVWADAHIKGNTVVVSSPKVVKPVAVRYAWANNPEGCNLYNSAGLPASPFRTDDWPCTTLNNK